MRAPADHGRLRGGSIEKRAQKGKMIKKQVVSQFALTLFFPLQFGRLGGFRVLFEDTKMPGQRELFEIQRGGRTLSISRSSQGNRKLYVGAVNGEVCAFAPAKGDLLRALIRLSQSYPKAKPRRHVARPRKSR